jgi:hypothetical protein
MMISRGEAHRKGGSAVTQQVIEAGFPLEPLERVSSVNDKPTPRS